VRTVQSGNERTGFIYKIHQSTNRTQIRYLQYICTNVQSLAKHSNGATSVTTPYRAAEKYHKTCSTDLNSILWFLAALDRPAALRTSKIAREQTPKATASGAEPESKRVGRAHVSFKRLGKKQRLTHASGRLSSWPLQRPVC